MKYFEFNIDTYEDASYIFLFGGRSSGKSTSVVKAAFNNYMNNNSFKFVRIFRDMAARSKGDGWFRNINPDVKFEVGSYKYNSNTFCDTITLTMEETYKGNQYPDCQWMIFDEFVLRDPIRYRFRECESLMSAVSTVFRHRDGRVILIGNNLNEMSKYNPFFKFFGLNWDSININLGDIYFWTAPSTEFSEPAKCAIHFIPIAYTSEAEIPKMQRVAGNDVATTGKFAHDPSIIPTYFQNVKDIWWRCVIEYNGIKIAIGFDHERKLILIGEYPGKHADRRLRLNNHVDYVKFFSGTIYDNIRAKQMRRWKIIYSSPAVKSIWLDINKNLPQY